MLFTMYTLYLKIKQKWDNWLYPKHRNIKTLSTHIETTNVDGDSSSGDNWSPYNNYY